MKALNNKCVFFSSSFKSPLLFMYSSTSFLSSTSYQRHYFASYLAHISTLFRNSYLWSLRSFRVFVLLHFCITVSVRYLPIPSFLLLYLYLSNYSWRSFGGGFSIIPISSVLHAADRLLQIHSVSGANVELRCPYTLFLCITYSYWQNTINKG